MCTHWRKPCWAVMWMVRALGTGLMGPTSASHQDQGGSGSFCLLSVLSFYLWHLLMCSLSPWLGLC